MLWTPLHPTSFSHHQHHPNDVVTSPRLTTTTSNSNLPQPQSQIHIDMLDQRCNTITTAPSPPPPPPSQIISLSLSLSPHAHHLQRLTIAIFLAILCLSPRVTISTPSLIELEMDRVESSTLQIEWGLEERKGAPSCDVLSKRNNLVATAIVDNVDKTVSTYLVHRSTSGENSD